MDGCVDGWMDKRISGWIDGRMDRWKDGWGRLKNGCISEWMHAYMILP